MRLFSGPKSPYPGPATFALPDARHVIEADYGAHRLVGVLRDGVGPYIGHPAYALDEIAARGTLNEIQLNTQKHPQ